MGRLDNQLPGIRVDPQISGDKVTVKRDVQLDLILLRKALEMVQRAANEEAIALGFLMYRELLPGAVRKEGLNLDTRHFFQDLAVKDTRELQLRELSDLLD